MRRLIKTLFLGCAILAVLGMVAIFAAALFGHGHHALWQPDFSLSINGEDVDVDSFTGPGWLAALIAMGVVGLVVGVLLPMILLLGIGLPLLIVGIVIGALVLTACGVGAVVCSPFVLIGLFILWLVKPRRAPR